VSGTRSTELDALVAGLAPLIGATGDAPEIYVVGGAVRDALLGGVGGDVDLAVDGELDDLVRALGGEVRTHERFETATVVVDRVVYDLARTRTEKYSSPGALPDVTPAPIADDLGRRDFTVNAMAVVLNGPRAGELITFDGALEDLGAARLRILHPKSFVRDPTRLFRLVRYGARLGFFVEEQTQALALAAIARGALDTVSGARIGNELRLLAGEDDPVAAVAALSTVGLDEALDPSFGLGNAELARRALTLLPEDGRRGLLVLAAALLDVAPDRIASLLDGWAFAGGDRDVILAAALRAEKLSLRLEMAGQPSEIDAAVARAGAGLETVALAGAIGPTAVAREWLAELRHKQLEITGDDVVAAGVPPGPAIGVALAAARAALLDGEAVEAASQLAAALAAAS
jgi:tRNA nucleotidyltransferase (CCA-adding enzyme)